MILLMVRFLLLNVEETTKGFERKRITVFLQTRVEQNAPRNIKKATEKSIDSSAFMAIEWQEKNQITHAA